MAGYGSDDVSRCPLDAIPGKTKLQFLLDPLNPPMGSTRKQVVSLLIGHSDREITLWSLASGYPTQIAMVSYMELREAIPEDLMRGKHFLSGIFTKFTGSGLSDIKMVPISREEGESALLVSAQLSGDLYFWLWSPLNDVDVKFLCRGPAELTVLEGMAFCRMGVEMPKDALLLVSPQGSIYSHLNGSWTCLRTGEEEVNGCKFNRFDHETVSLVTVGQSAAQILMLSGSSALEIGSVMLRGPVERVMAKWISDEQMLLIAVEQAGTEIIGLDLSEFTKITESFRQSVSKYTLWTIHQGTR